MDRDRTVLQSLLVAYVTRSMVIDSRRLVRPWSFPSAIRHVDLSPQMSCPIERGIRQAVCLKITQWIIS